jgi:hypothetical protein
VYEASRTGFRAVGAANRAFSAAQKRGSAERPTSVTGRDLFDLTPTDEQKMIVEATSEFAAEQLRPAAAEADSACVAPAEILKRSVGLRSLRRSMISVLASLLSAASPTPMTSRRRLLRGFVGTAIPAPGGSAWDTLSGITSLKVTRQ